MLRLIMQLLVQRLKKNCPDKGSDHKATMGDLAEAGTCYKNAASKCTADVCSTYFNCLGSCLGSSNILLA